MGQPEQTAENQESGSDSGDQKKSATNRDTQSSEPKKDAADEADAGENEKRDDGGKNGKGQDDKEADKKPKKPPIYKKPAFIITASIVLVVLVAGGIVIWLIARQFVSTDDAYIDGHVAQISPQISARVISLHIDDNQMVHQGDLLVELDPTDYRIAVDQAAAQVAASEGRLEQARAQIASSRASVTQAAAEVDAAQVTLDNVTRDLQRLTEVDARARSQQQLDNATTAQKNAQAQLEQTRARKTLADANVTTSEAAVKASEGELKTAHANEAKAQVDLSYCKILAPVDGRVTQRSIETGNYITVGQALFMLVDPNVWVTANFKETQLTHMQPGQDVTIKVDAFPGKKWHGKVDSIQAGSGSRFSVLPAENATGNFVKVVQRVPVKIVFEHDANTNNAFMLSPGLSVIPRVRVR